MRRRAFTLIELIITGSIITLLIAISLPAIGRAQYAARRASCGTQIRALVLSMSVYTQENGNWLPPGPREIAPDGRFGNDPDRGNPLELFASYRVGRADCSSQNGWYGQGLLWQQGFVNQPRIFYCVEMARTGATFVQCWPQHMEKAPDYAGESSTVLSSYIYRGGYASARGTVDGPLNTARHLAGEPILADSPFFGKMVHANGFTVGYLGGQVEFQTFNKSPVKSFGVGPLWTAVGPGATTTSATRPAP
jgi:type II secretory pathway pseudopilin PulG